MYSVQTRRAKLGIVGFSVVLGGLAGAAAVRRAGKLAAANQLRSSHFDINALADPKTQRELAISPDDLDKDQLDQLHAATLKASDSCFEIKKLCATVLVPTANLVSI